MTYDGLDRLRTVTAPGFGNALYEYDALDNLRRAKVGSRDRTHYFDPTNRLVNVIETGTGATVTGLGYDVQGNLSVRNGQAFAFDYGNRLRAAGTAESYEYDAHGRRVKASASGKQSTRSTTTAVCCDSSATNVPANRPTISTCQAAWCPRCMAKPHPAFPR